VTFGGLQNVIVESIPTGATLLEVLLPEVAKT